MNIGENKLVLELKEKIDEATFELMTTIIEETELIKKGIAVKTEYIIKIGQYEIEKYNLFFEHMKLRRKVEIYQAAINRQEPISIETVNQIIEEETKEYKEELDGLIKDLHTANLLLKAKKVTDEEYKTIKETYRYIVNRIHPDINPNINENTKLLWHMTQNAYINNDLKQLLLVKTMVDKENINIERENIIEVLEKRLAQILFNIDEIKDRMKVMLTLFPLNKEDLLKQEDEIEKIVSNLKFEIELYKRYNEELQMRIQELINEGEGLLSE